MGTVGMVQLLRGHCLASYSVEGLAVIRLRMMRVEVPAGSALEEGLMKEARSRSTCRLGGLLQGGWRSVGSCNMRMGLGNISRGQRDAAGVRHYEAAPATGERATAVLAFA